MPKTHAGWVKAVMTGAAASLLAMLSVSCAKDSGSDQSTATTNAAGQVTVSIASSGGPKPGGSLIYGIEAETDGFDPTTNRWAISGLMIANAFTDPIAAFDINKQPQPYLAESFNHNPDYTEWIIKSRPNIKFHNGQPVDAAAGKKFTDAIKSSVLTGPAARPIESTEIVDTLTLKIKMSQPWVAFPALLTGQGGMMIAPEQIDKSAAKNPEGSLKPIGTGPFKFSEYIRDSHWIGTKNTDYWQTDKAGNKLPYLDKVTFKPLPDVQSRIQSLLAGDVNVIHSDYYDKVETLRTAANQGKIQFFEGGGEDEESFAMINVQEPPLSDKRLRQALAYATDLSVIEAITGAPEDQRADSPFNKNGDWYADPNYPKFDLSKARALVDTWKAENGGAAPKFTLSSTPSPDVAKVTQALQQLWQQAGFEVTLETGEQTKIILNAVTANYQAVYFRQFSAPDPDGETHWWLGANAAPKGTIGLNFARIKSEQLDAALTKGRGSPELADRKAAYVDVAKVLADEVPYVWLHHVRWSIATDTRVRDVLNGLLPDGVTQSLPVQAGVHRLTYAWLAS